MGITHSIFSVQYWWSLLPRVISSSNNITALDVSQLPKHLYDEYVVDLHDLLVLLNYERGRCDPHFHQTKLQEVTTTTFQTTTLTRKAEKKWTRSDPSHRLGIVFQSHAVEDVEDVDDWSEDLELPTNILKTPVPPSLSNLTPQQQETIYWRARNHGGSETTTDLLECLFETWPDPPPLLRVRLPPAGNKPATEYIASPYFREAVEFTLHDPTEVTVTVTPAKTFVRNATNGEIDYSVIGLSPLKTLTGVSGPVDTIVDLASMQHGDIGRGYHTKDAFIVARLEDYVKDYLPKFAKSNTFGQATHHRMARRLSRTGIWSNEMLEKVDNVRKYWKYKHKRTFCAFCGVPEGFRGDGEPLIPCSHCQSDFYCSHFHQHSAWMYHQHFCQAAPQA